ncbi:MAG: hypothetical protein IT361_03325 [Gemmatimonadaceae bacterium]|nr:hypothetical protein [Gemmatimonadaceae bacterium]
MRPTQTIENHVRWNPLYHFVALPILLVNIVVAGVALVRQPGAASAWAAVVAFATMLGIGLARAQALTVQNRVIRLEERLRLRALLPAADHPAVDALRVRDLIALRFASDAEVPALFRRVLTGEFARPSDIKKAVREWRPDHLRV